MEQDFDYQSYVIDKSTYRNWSGNQQEDLLDQELEEEYEENNY